MCLPFLLPCCAVAGYKVRGALRAAGLRPDLPLRSRFRRRCWELWLPIACLMRWWRRPCAARLQANKTADKLFGDKGKPQEPSEPAFVTEAKLKWNVSAAG